MNIRLGSIVNFFIRTILLVVGIVLLGLGVNQKNVPMLSIAILLVWLNNFIYSFGDIKERFVFFLFHLCFFTFLIGRPIIGTLFRGEWWIAGGQSWENICFGFVAVTLSLLAVYLGAIFYNKIETNFDIKEKQIDIKSIRFVEKLQTVSLVIFSISAVFFGIQECEKLIYMFGKNYVDFYSGFQASLPSIIYTLASFMKYSLCIFLATMPSKKRAFFPLAVYGMSALPDLFIGMRNPFVLNILFILTYYIIRDYKSDKKVTWFGKTEKILSGMCIPIGVVFLSLYAQIRSNLGITLSNVLGSITNFFYDQGVTFEVIMKCYGWRFNLPDRVFRNYTFGGFIDYVLYGRIGQTLFGTTALPGYNSWENGRLSNNLSHNFAYATQPEQYLEGRGWGSSYIIENYIDFGYIGVFILSLVLGMLLIFFVKRFGQNKLLNIIILLSITGIYFIPRAEATGWATFLITLQFWACLLGCYMLSKAWTRIVIKLECFKKNGDS